MFLGRAQAGQRGHGGCSSGRVYSQGFYSPFRLVRWQGGRVAMQQPLQDMDPLKALRLCSPRFPMARDPPTLAPVKPEWFPRHGPHRIKRPSAASAGACSSPLPQDVQDEVSQLIHAAMCKEGFKLDSEEDVQPPQFTSIKQQGPGILAAGRFFCKIGGDYHHQSISFFMLWPDGGLIQKCHKTGCEGRVGCGKWSLPPKTAALLSLAGQPPKSQKLKQEQD